MLENRKPHTIYIFPKSKNFFLLFIYFNKSKMIIKTKETEIATMNPSNLKGTVLNTLFKGE